MSRPDDSEPRIAEFYRDQREHDSADAPDFTKLWAAAQRSAADPTHRSEPFAPRWFPIAASAAAAALVVLVLAFAVGGWFGNGTRDANPQPTASADPDLVDLLASLDAALVSHSPNVLAWESPTQSLLVFAPTPDINQPTNP